MNFSVLSVSSSGGHSIYESADAPPLPSKAVTNGSHSTNGVENANGGSHSVSNCPPTNVPLYSNNNGENGVGHDYAIKSVEHLSVGQFDPISPRKFLILIFNVELFYSNYEIIDHLKKKLRIVRKV